jgi:hypothetical protein
MERRNFVLAAICALAAPFLPGAQLAQAAPNLTEWNAATLTSAMERMFKCQVGPKAKAFAFVNGMANELPLIEVGPKDMPNSRWLELAPHENTVSYVTLACAVEGGDKKEAEARLAKHFYDHLSQLPSGPLVWRTKPEFSSVEDVKYGHTYCTAKAVEDRLFDFSHLPADAELDVVNNSYRQVLSKIQLHRMRMRLALPELVEDFVLPYVKEEGEMLAVI